MDPQKLNEILNLPNEDKLNIMNAIKESLNDDLLKREIPEWQKEILEERLKKIENGEMELISWDEVKEMIQKRLKNK